MHARAHSSMHAHAYACTYAGEFNLVGNDAAGALQAAAEATGRRLLHPWTSGFLDRVTGRGQPDLSRGWGSRGPGHQGTRGAELDLPSRDCRRRRLNASVSGSVAVPLAEWAVQGSRGPVAPAELTSLLDVLAAFGLAMGVVLSAQLLGFCCWKYR